MPSGSVLLILFVIIIVSASMLFWLWMLIDCATNQKLSITQKLIWILVVSFLHPLGALLYFFLGRSPKQAQIVYQPPTSIQQHSPQAPSATYYPYQQGYQAVPPVSSPYQSATTPPLISYEQAPPLDYEQPQAMYPHDHNNG